MSDPESPEAHMWKSVAGALLVGLMLAGCSTSNEVTSSLAEPGIADGGVASPSGELKSEAVVERAVITTAQMTVRVEVIQESVRDLADMVAAHDGLIEFQDFSKTQDGAYASVTARVPSDHLEALIDEVSTLGDVAQVSRQAADVTQQTVDLDARIAALTASISRLRELLDASTNVADLVAVETELSNRQADLDSLTAQRSYLANQVSMSTLTVSLQEAISGVSGSPGFVDGIRNGWNALVTLAGAVLTSIGFLMPFIAIGLVGFALVWLVVRAVRRRRP